MSFAAIHIPEFPVAAWQRSSPELRMQPCAVLEGFAPQEKVISLCERARSAGIEHGMSKVQAEAGGTTIVRSRQIEEEKAAFTSLIDLAERFSPRVEAIASPFNAYAEAHRLAALLLIDSSGTGTLFGSAESHARRLYRELHIGGFSAGIGAAPNAEAALLLARGSRGVVCADRDSVRGKLARLPVSLLPCEAKTLAVLNRWGIRTLGELGALPETALISRLGQQGRRLQMLARGEAEHLLVPEEPALTLSETTALDSPVELLDSLLFVLSPMLEAILRKAINRAYALRSVRLTLNLERKEPYILQVRPATRDGTYDAAPELQTVDRNSSEPLSVSIPHVTEIPGTTGRRRYGLFDSSPCQRMVTDPGCGCPRIRIPLTRSQPIQASGVRAQNHSQSAPLVDGLNPSTKVHRSAARENPLRFLPIPHPAHSTRSSRSACRGRSLPEPLP